MFICKECKKWKYIDKDICNDCREPSDYERSLEKRITDIEKEVNMLKATIARHLNEPNYFAEYK